MPMYDYWCQPGGHEILEFHAMRDTPSTVYCVQHDFAAPRSFGSQQVNNTDHFRSYYLSGRGDKAANAQGRPVQGPRDKHEAKAIEARTGRIYIGDDRERLSEKGQRAVSKTFAHNEPT